MDGSLTYEILGAKFFGDLLANGFIRMSGTNQVFANPSSWANYCRSTIPSTSKDHKNYGSAWSIIRYLGKRLDSYKLRWYRKQKKQFTLGGTIINGQNCSVNTPTVIGSDRLYKLDKISAGDPEISILENNPNENIINFNSIDLNNKDFNLDDRTKIACVPFNSVFCLQPFLVTISTNVLLLIDFHSHLISTEVNGYLAGLWDPRTQHLTITQAFPLRCKSSKEFDSCTLKIKQNLVQKGLILVGWYHSHPRTAPHPSIADIKRQLKYQKQMLATKKDVRDYSPCVGLICSPFYSNNNNNNNNDDIKLTTLFQMFWVMPIFTMGNRNIGRPMQISYQIARDAFLTQDLLVEMRVLAAHFAVHQKFIKFNDTYNGESTSYWNKLQESLKTKLPRDLVEQQSQAVQNDIQQQALMHFWSFLKNLLLIST
ncbi:hypothetical protein DERP_009039 [Dermatophagoides pteronyssinus]|uniref:MPN domain-containing protein n=1 Tax=Dermatophagoides pteronyssinus TaxID=6956 RepID=A0ABQ8JGU9_DERPT|nr:hypothetical protein DERP_009039 [Dermatophagoides pteronyssinus]